jgi:hypothetical protein
MRKEIAVQEEKPSTIRKIIVGIVIAIVVVGIIVSGIAFQMSQRLGSGNSPYVEVYYKTIGWNYTYDNHAYLVLNVTITNKGHTDGVPVANALFWVNISNVEYGSTESISITNSTGPLGYSELYLSLQPVTLMNNGTLNGTILFELPKTLYNQPFTLICTMTSTKYQKVNVRISEG